MDRYAVQMDEAGWTVFDSHAEEPATFEGEPLCGLPFVKAGEFVSLLNWYATRTEVILLH